MQVRLGLSRIGLELEQAHTLNIAPIAPGGVREDRLGVFFACLETHRLHVGRDRLSVSVCLVQGLDAHPHDHGFKGLQQRRWRRLQQAQGLAGHVQHQQVALLGVQRQAVKGLLDGPRRHRLPLRHPRSRVVN